MKRIKIIISLLLIVFYNLYADDHIFSLRYTADPWALVYNDRVYLFCSHDRYEPGMRYIMNDITCISTDDMKNWTDHGIVFSIKDCKWGASLSWAPSVAFRNGTFYLYYGDGDKSIGVATSLNITGPYVDNNDGPIVSKTTPGVLELGKNNQPVKPQKDIPGALKGSENWGFWCFDPSVFIDDDGQAYLYFGGANPENSRVIKLKSNMIEVDGFAEKLNAPGFFEASFVHKHNGKYYFSYSGHYFNKPSNIDYVTSINPMKGFANAGIVMKNPPNNDGFNHHHSIFKFKGNWYIAYHNRELAIKNGIDSITAREFMRSICVDKLYYNPNGSIKEVQFTKNGLQQLKYINPYQWNEAETMSWAVGGLNTKAFNGGRYVNQIKNGSWILIKGVDFGTKDVTQFEACVASGNIGGFLEVRLNSPTGEVISRLAFGNTGGWERIKEVKSTARKIKGVHDIYFVFHGDMGELFVFDKWRFN